MVSRICSGFLAIPFFLCAASGLTAEQTPKTNVKTVPAQQTKIKKETAPASASVSKGKQISAATAVKKTSIPPLSRAEILKLRREQRRWLVQMQRRKYTLAKTNPKLKKINEQIRELQKKKQEVIASDKEYADIASKYQEIIRKLRTSRPARRLPRPGTWQIKRRSTVKKQAVLSPPPVPQAPPAK